MYQRCRKCSVKMSDGKQEIAKGKCPKCGKRDGIWVAVADLGRGPDGKRQRRVFYGDTRDKAAEAMADALAGHRRGELADPGRITVAEYLQRWLEHIKPSVELRTWVGYESHVRLHISPLLGAKLLRELKPVHLQDLYTNRLAAGKAPRTVHHSHTIFHTALAQAVEWQLLNRNPAEVARPPKAPKTVHRFLDFDEAKRLISALEGDDFGPMLMVAMLTAVRSGELRALRWADLDLSTGQAVITQSVWYPKGGARFKTSTKSDRHRQVVISEDILAFIRQHRTRQLARRLKAGVWHDHDLVFCRSDGRPLDHQAPLDRLRAALNRAGLPPIRLHDLRHSAASLLLALGVPIKDVSEILGHSSIAITADLYGHLVPGAQQRAADRLSNALFGTEAESQSQATSPPNRRSRA